MKAGGGGKMKEIIYCRTPSNSCQANVDRSTPPLWNYQRVQITTETRTAGYFCSKGLRALARSWFSLLVRARHPLVISRKTSNLKSTNLNKRSKTWRTITMVNQRLLWIFLANFFHTRVFTMSILNYGGFYSYNYIGIWWRNMNLIFRQIDTSPYMKWFWLLINDLED